MSSNELIISIVGVVFTIAAFFIGIVQLWVGVYPVWQEYLNRQILNDNFSRGPYDKETIERSTKYYIRPKCSNIDPSQEEELRHALIATREDLFQKVDQFLMPGNPRKHLLILADSGTGKTSFMLNYYAYNIQKTRSKRHKISIVPLGSKNADELIDQIPNKTSVVVFLDAFDEDIKAIQDHRQRIIDLMDKCRDFRKIVITCRTQFFPKDEEIPIETGIVKIGPVRAGEKRSYEFWKIYLSPFDDTDIKKYIAKRYPIWKNEIRKKAEKMALRIPLLSVRPMLLANIPEVIERDISIKHTYQLYEIMLDAWLERESHWVEKSSLRMFSQKIAIDLYLNRERRGMERIPQSELALLANQWKINLKEWQITGRSILNRDADGNYKFAHRSFMEYLFVLMLASGDASCYGAELTDQMKFFLIEMISRSNIPETVKIENVFKSSRIFVVSANDKLNPESLRNQIRVGRLVGKSFQILSTFNNHIYIRNIKDNNLFRISAESLNDISLAIGDSAAITEQQALKVVGREDWENISKINSYGELSIFPIPPKFDVIAVQLDYLEKLDREKRINAIQ